MSPQQSRFCFVQLGAPSAGPAKPSVDEVQSAARLAVMMASAAAADSAAGSLAVSAAPLAAGTPPTAASLAAAVPQSQSSAAFPPQPAASLSLHMPPASQQAPQPVLAVLPAQPPVPFSAANASQMTPPLSAPSLRPTPAALPQASAILHGNLNGQWRPQLPFSTGSSISRPSPLALVPGSLAAQRPPLLRLGAALPSHPAAGMLSHPPPASIATVVPVPLSSAAQPAPPMQHPASPMPPVLSGPHSMLQEAVARHPRFPPPDVQHPAEAPQQPSMVGPQPSMQQSNDAGLVASGCEEFEHKSNAAQGVPVSASSAEGMASNGGASIAGTYIEHP